MITSYNPYNNEILREFDEISKVELDEILIETQIARKTWEKFSLDERADILKDVSIGISSNLEGIVQNIVLETGMPISEARSSTLKLIDRINFLCEKTPEFLSNEIYDLKDGRKNIITYNPIGTVACIMPWNHPFIIPFWTIIPALIAGNSVIYKPSELTPLVGDTISNLFQEIDLPDYLFSVIQGDGEIGRELSTSNNIDMISFAGSVTVAKKVFARSSKNMKKLVLENGGKDALIVGDCDNKLEVANEILKGAFRHAGQLCSSVRRVYILEEDLNEYLNLFTKIIDKYVVGNPLEEETFIGPLKTKKQLYDLKCKLFDAMNKGAKVLFENKVEDNFFYPIILYNANENMDVVKEEVFGPMLPIISVKNIEEAVIREIKEETGLDINLEPKEFHRIKMLKPHHVEIHPINENHEHISFTYFAEPCGGVLKTESIEHKDIRWFSLKDLESDEINIEIEHFGKEAIKRFQKGDKNENRNC